MLLLPSIRFLFLVILVICTLSCQKPCEALGPSANLLGSMSSSRLLSSGKLTVTPNGQWMVIGEPAHVLAELSKKDLERKFQDRNTKEKMREILQATRMLSTYLGHY